VGGESKKKIYKKDMAIKDLLGGKEGDKQCKSDGIEVTACISSYCEAFKKEKRTFCVGKGVRREQMSRAIIKNPGRLRGGDRLCDITTVLTGQEGRRGKKELTDFWCGENWANGSRSK